MISIFIILMFVFYQHCQTLVILTKMLQSKNGSAESYILTSSDSFLEFGCY